MKINRDHAFKNFLNKVERDYQATITSCNERSKKDFNALKTIVFEI